MIQIHPDIINICKALQTIVSNYEQECRELTVRAGTASVEFEKAKARQKFEKNLQVFLPKEDLEALDARALSGSLEAESYKPDTRMPDGLFMGTIRYAIKMDTDCEYISQVLDAAYGEFIRFGTVLVLPLLLTAKASHLIFIENKDWESAVIESVKGFTCRYLLKMPVAGVDCYFIDGLRGRSSFEIFQPLEGHGLEIVKNGWAYTMEGICQMLDSILNIKNYSRQSLLVINNFPALFSAESLDKLEKILLHSTQLGITVMINYNAKANTVKEGEINNKIRRLKQYMSCFEYVSEWLLPADSAPYAISLNKIPRNWNRLLQTYINEAVLRNQCLGVVNKQSEDNSNLFSRELSLLHSIKPSS